MRPMKAIAGLVALVFVVSVSVMPVEAASAQAPSTSVVLPTNNATVSGTSQVFDAVASLGAIQVQYEITGGTLSGSVIAKGALWIFGWLAEWNTTTVPNGTYVLQSIASYSGGVTTISSPVTIEVNNPPPRTTVLVPASGTIVNSLNTMVFDAVAPPGVTQVLIDLTGQVPFTLTATATIYGWIATLGPFPGPVGPIPLPYSVQSVASYSGGVSGTSPPVNVTIDAYTTIP
jgi:hypothetical protein